MIVDAALPVDGSGEAIVTVATDSDVLLARQTGRRVAESVGFSGSDLTMVSTAISEVARNIIRYAGKGEVVVGPIAEGNRVGVVVVARDNGPGIADLDLAMRDGYTTGSGMGLGLPGARRLMDDFAISSQVAEGTTVVMKKWTRGH